MYKRSLIDFRRFRFVKLLLKLKKDDLPPTSSLAFVDTAPSFLLRTAHLYTPASVGTAFLMTRLSFPSFAYENVNRSLEVVKTAEFLKGEKISVNIFAWPDITQN